MPSSVSTISSKFQSTLSMRRATYICKSMLSIARFQSTLSMRRATPFLAPHVIDGEISIHALHEESDPWQRYVADVAGISIHALHEESDRLEPQGLSAHIRISIHALHEESDFLRRPVDGFAG